jgi:hypothetical protein
MKAAVMEEIRKPGSVLASMDTFATVGVTVIDRY